MCHYNTTDHHLASEHAVEVGLHDRLARSTPVWREARSTHLEARSTHLETPPARSTHLEPPTPNPLHPTSYTQPPTPNHHTSSHTSQNNLKIRLLTVLMVCWRPPPSHAFSVCVCMFLLVVGVVWEECGWVYVHTRGETSDIPR